MGLEAAEHHAKHSGYGTCQCGHPIEVAWHSEMDGWYEGEKYQCHACTARAGKPVFYTVVRDTRPPDRRELPPFVLGKTTTSE